MGNSYDGSCVKDIQQTSGSEDLELGGIFLGLLSLYTGKSKINMPGDLDVCLLPVFSHKREGGKPSDEIFRGINPLVRASPLGPHLNLITPKDLISKYHSV